MSKNPFDVVKWNRYGFVPAVIQDAENGDVLMMAWMNRESLCHTMETRYVTFWSRSRQKLWVKGEASGHTQKVCSVELDCDGDCLLIRVKQVVAACHKGYRSCFFRSLSSDWEVKENQPRIFDPSIVYKTTS